MKTNQNEDEVVENILSVGFNYELGEIQDYSDGLLGFYAEALGDGGYDSVEMSFKKGREELMRVVKEAQEDCGEDDEEIVNELDGLLEKVKEKVKGKKVKWKFWGLELDANLACIILD